MRLRTTLFALVLIGMTAPAAELPIKPIVTEFDKHAFIVPLVAPWARSAAVGDGWAAIGQVTEKEKAPQISLFKLDAAGKPAGMPVVIKIPRPAALPERLVYPQALLFHPKLPLLYVWLDTDQPLTPPYADETHPHIKELDHLHVIALDGAAPSLALSLARGPGFMVGCHSGTLTYDPPTSRLYVPNLRHGVKQDISSGIGWYHLGPDGLPLASDVEPPAKEVPPVASAQAAAERPARAATLRALLAAGKPVGAYRTTPEKCYGLGYFPTGAGILPISRDMLVIGGAYGLVTWNLADRAARSCVFLMPVTQSYYATRLVGHPALPVVFAAMAGRSELYRMELADGLPTLAPQIAVVESIAFQGCPIVLTKRNQLAVCTTAAAYGLVSFDAEGRYVATGALQLNVHAPATGGTHALAYSDKHDLLYVGVEKLK